SSGIWFGAQALVLRPHVKGAGWWVLAGLLTSVLLATSSFHPGRSTTTQLSLLVTQVAQPTLVAAVTGLLLARWLAPSEPGRSAA
ncbi:MAG TPA: hypothetical protein VK131_00320, partial [Candidatus Acidoferrales bacterium]|nr:hypothetical protein [Candidatus Acidoferrales bacterium]